MTTYDEAWVKAEEAKRQWLHDNGLYKQDDEHASCGVGLVVSISGKPSRKVVENGINALKAVWHRGAVDADGKTGDGAGIHVDLPVRFFDDAIAASGHKVRPNRLAVGMVFLPRTDLGAQENCRTIVEAEIIDARTNQTVAKVVRKVFGTTLENESQKITAQDFKAAIDKLNVDLWAFIRS